MDPIEEREFHDFVVGQWHAMLRTAYLLTGDHGEAEDLVQSTLVRVHRNWHRVERRDAPHVYARRIMVNLNTSIWRRRRIREHPTDAPPERPGADAMAAYDLRDQLRRACLQLPARQRAVLVLRYFEDMSEADTARALGISVGAVKSQTSRGLHRLRQIVGKDTDFPGTPSTTSAPTAEGSPA
jgi:RNA polymerase sigma-70 factor (sigma-E family)